METSARKLGNSSTRLKGRILFLGKHSCYSDFNVKTWRQHCDKAKCRRPFVVVKPRHRWLVNRKPGTLTAGGWQEGCSYHIHHPASRLTCIPSKKKLTSPGPGCCPLWRLKSARFWSKGAPHNSWSFLKNIDLPQTWFCPRRVQNARDSTRTWQQVAFTLCTARAVLARPPGHAHLAARDWLEYDRVSAIA